MHNRVRPESIRRCLMASTTALLCAGCFGGGSGSSSGLFAAAPFDLNQACPSIAAVNDARDVVVFGPGDRKVAENVDYAGLILDAELSCSASGEQVQISGKVEIMLELGEANQGRSISAPFFVAITDLDSGQVVARQQLAADFTFGRRSDTKVTERFEETLDLSVPNPPLRTQALVGFQLTREQLEFNRRRRGTGAPLKASGEMVGPMIAQPQPLPEPMFSSGPKLAPAPVGGQPAPPGLQSPEPPVPTAAPRVAVTGGGALPPALQPTPPGDQTPANIAIPVPTAPARRLNLPLAAPSEPVEPPPITQTTPAAVPPPTTTAQPAPAAAPPPALQAPVPAQPAPAVQVPPAQAQPDEPRPALTLPPLPVPTTGG